MTVKQRQENKEKIILVVQRYGLEVSGGAELHCRWTAEHLIEHFEVEVLTTTALDYITWKNHYKRGKEYINGVKVTRYPVAKERNLERFGRVQNKIFYEQHTLEDERRWVEEGGPVSPSLLKGIKDKSPAALAVLFWSYRYWQSFYGLDVCPEKSILVPTAERDRLLDLALFREKLRKPAGMVFLTPEERDIVLSAAGKNDIPSIVSSCGIESADHSKASGDSFRKKYGIESPFILYVGRIDRNKGCRQLIDFFTAFKGRNGMDIKLVLLGSVMMKFAKNDDIIAPGFVNENDKRAALFAADALIMPSFYESLSIILLEAWAAGCPTLVNGQCEVLKGQTLRSGAGLYYENYIEFEEGLKILLDNPSVRAEMSHNGKNYIKNNHGWDKISREYADFIHKIGQA